MTTFSLLAASAIALTIAAPILAAPASGISAQRMSDVDKYISSDAFEGRGPATPAETKTIHYIAQQYKEIGLQPAGDTANGQRSYFQNVPLLKSDIVGNPQFTLNLGNGRSLQLTQGDQIALKAPLNGQNAVKLANAPLLFVGYGVTAPERGWDDFKGQDVRGKLLVVLINDPDFEGGEGNFGGKAMTYYGRWTYKYEEAARRGAAGVLIVHETDPASYGWNTVKNSNTNTQFDIVRPNPAGAHTVFESWIQRPLAEQISRRFRPELRSGQGPGEDQGLPAHSAEGDAQRRSTGERGHDYVAQRRRLSSGQEASGRNGDLQRALGSPRHRPAG